MRPHSEPQVNRDARRRIVFVTGTRADFGKQKSLMARVRDSREFEHGIFVTGMHMLARYDSTINEILKAGFHQVFPYINQDASVDSQMDLVLANTIQGLGHYVREFHPELIIVHGDRIETLAGAIVGALNNILVGHIEGGEVSGTVDELLRHSVSKLSHLHFVSNQESRRRLIQMGESPSSIYVIGSPEVDTMLSDELPSIDEVRARYDIQFPAYHVFAYHPVTGELNALPENIRAVISALEQSGRNFVAIYPNNDTGSNVIMEELAKLRQHPRFRIFPSLRFEYFLTLMKHAQSVVGNSSCGIHEAPVYGVPTLNIGTRQMNRFRHPSIINVREDTTEVLDALRSTPRHFAPTLHFGNGKSAELFMNHLSSPSLWSTPRQKQFCDIRVLGSGPRPAGREEVSWAEVDPARAAQAGCGSDWEVDSSRPEAATALEAEPPRLAMDAVPNGLGFSCFARLALS
jgi:UDP-N-acetylglucosamine 2-epimerase (hydrolysing)